MSAKLSMLLANDLLFCSIRFLLLPVTSSLIEKQELIHVVVVDSKLQKKLEVITGPDCDVTYDSEIHGKVIPMAEFHEKFRQIVPRDSILIGHALRDDLRSMRLSHSHVIDTIEAYNMPRERKNINKAKLRDLAYILLNWEIQEFRAKTARHDTLEDAQATMLLALLKLRNAPGFGDLSTDDNSLRWPNGLADFVPWYHAMAERQQRRRENYAARGQQGGESPRSLRTCDRVERC